MRQVSPKVQEDRKRKILQAVIHHYIKTARPVGSSILTEEYDFGLSPAAIRSFMSELEEDGFLTHPHTSAGRVPTDKGYRYYVDSLMELQRMAIEEEDRIRKEYRGRMNELNEVLVKTSKVLSAMSQYTGFVMAPKLERNLIKHVELVYLNEKTLLALLVTHTGLVKHHIIESHIKKDRLPRLNDILNDKLQGMTLSEAKRKFIEKLEEALEEEREIISFAKDLGGHLFDIDDEIYMDGASNVLTLPEFQDYEPMRCLMRISEDRDILSRFLEKDMNNEKVRVLIGSETSCSELQSLSVVSAVYKEGKRPVGVLGIIGPKRMEYPKMMSLVESVTKVVNKLLEDFGG